MEQSVQVQVLSAAPVLLFENYLGSSFFVFTNFYDQFALHNLFEIGR